MDTQIPSSSAEGTIWFDNDPKHLWKRPIYGNRPDERKAHTAM